MTVALALALCTNSSIPGGPPPSNPKAIEELRAGGRQEANASWWGFDPENSTKAIQSAIDSGAKRVVVPNVGREWIVDPIHLKGDQEVVFERGVVVAARKGGFQKLNDCLFKADRQRNLMIRGYGATLRMQKPEYAKGEWRMCLELDSCTNVKVYGLTLASSGGDGLYLGDTDSKQPFCRDIHVKDCVLDGNRRQGMSVISAVNLLVERCVFRNTLGTAPQAGVDLEPNLPTERLENIVFRDCRMVDNAGAGVLIYTGMLDTTSAPLDVRFESCSISSVAGTGIEVGGTGRDFPLGRVEFRTCSVADCFGTGLNVFNKSESAWNPLFIRCSWRNVALGSVTISPIQLDDWDRSSTRVGGGIELRDCSLDDGLDRPFLAALPLVARNGVARVRGNILVRNPHGTTTSLGARARDIDLKTGRSTGKLT